MLAKPPLTHQVGDLNRQMWTQVNKHKDILPYKHQISFMVDRTVEHFKIQLQKKMKKKAQEAASAAAGTTGGSSKEVQLTFFILLLDLFVSTGFNTI